MSEKDKDFRISESKECTPRGAGVDKGLLLLTSGPKTLRRPPLSVPGRVTGAVYRSGLRDVRALSGSPGVPG